jgi:hypothetical protein
VLQRSAHRLLDFRLVKVNGEAAAAAAGRVLARRVLNHRLANRVERAINAAVVRLLLLQHARRLRVRERRRLQVRRDCVVVVVVVVRGGVVLCNRLLARQRADVLVALIRHVQLRRVTMVQRQHRAEVRGNRRQRGVVGGVEFTQRFRSFVQQHVHLVRLARDGKAFARRSQLHERGRVF